MIKFVEKRDGRVADYSKNKISNAIQATINHVSNEEARENIDSIVEQVENELAGLKKEKAHVEEIQDLVEKVLMEAGYLDVAREYILYREKRRQARKEKHKDSLLTEEFLSKYKHCPNPFPTELGEFVYYRTYSRWLPVEERREYWWETVGRAVEYNCSLAPTSRKEAEELYDNVYKLKNFLSGRTLWTGGTEASLKYPMSNYNCAFVVIDDLNAYRELFYLLMIGAGVGFRILPEDVNKLPKIRTDIEVIHEMYAPVTVELRQEYTNFKFDKNRVEIIVGDSKEGWSQALEYYLQFISRKEYKHIEMIIFNYNNVRSKGARLKTFGGTASGYGSLQTMFTKIDRIFANKESKWHKLTTTDCLDIANIIGENVVSGGVRRTSEICIFDRDDRDILQAKNNLYQQIDGKWIINEELVHRQMSNNTIYYREKPSREQLHWHIQQIRYSGEPGFLNAEEAGRRRSNFKGVNPCSEILLDSRGMCNLTSLNVAAFVTEDKTIARDELFKAQRLSARTAYRMALVEFELHKWDLVNKRDRLIGLSITGWQDMVNETSMTVEEQRKLLRELREVAHVSAREIAAQLGDNEPLLVTTIKPEGTYTQLPTVSSGLHFSHSPYYIRRVRISDTDPLVKVANQLGIPNFPEVGQTEENCQTRVLEFPVKAPQGRTKYDVSALEQLEVYKMFMEEYVDHNASITIHVRDNEWDQVEEWLWKKWDSVVGITFLSLDDSFYELMPYEAIDEVEYQKRLAGLNPFNPGLVAKYERELDRENQERELEADGCDNGVCPVR